MPEYESSKYLTIVKNRGDRRAIYAVTLFWVAVATASWVHFGGYDIWITRLLVWMAAGFITWLLVEHIRFRHAVRQLRGRSIEDNVIRLGDKSWFWTSDRDPDDPRVS